MMGEMVLYNSMGHWCQNLFILSANEPMKQVAAGDNSMIAFAAKNKLLYVSSLNHVCTG